MSNLGKSLILVGLLIALIGLGFIVFSRVKISFLGRLPGDIFIRKENFTFYFPLTTSLIVSAVLSLISYFIFRLSK